MGLSQDNLVRARQLIALYPHKRSALIPVLHLLQEQEGYLSPDGIEDVAALFELTPAEVRGTASFYDMFHLEPIGRYLVAVCTNIACMLDGAYELLAHIEEGLGVHPGGTTADGSFHPRGRRVPGPVRQRPLRHRQLAVFRQHDPAAVGRAGRRPAGGPARRRGPPARDVVPGPAVGGPPRPCSPDRGRRGRDPGTPRRAAKKAGAGTPASAAAAATDAAGRTGGAEDVAYDPGRGQHFARRRPGRHRGEGPVTADRGARPQGRAQDRNFPLRAP